jgi:hypothetical protein
MSYQKVEWKGDAREDVWLSVLEPGKEAARDDPNGNVLEVERAVELFNFYLDQRMNCIKETENEIERWKRAERNI